MSYFIFISVKETNDSVEGFAFMCSKAFVKIKFSLRAPIKCLCV